MAQQKIHHNLIEPPLIFSGTSYLGISQNKAFRQLIIEGLNLYGNNFGGSRNGNTAPLIYDAAETFLSNWLTLPQSVLVSSGTLAATFLKELILKEYHCFYEPDVHPSIYINNKKERSKMPIAFQEVVQLKIKQDLSKKYAICLNSIDPLYLSEKKFDWLDDLPQRADILVVIDDSHGIGVIGREGNGTAEEIAQLNLKKYIIYGSLGKALGTPAGFITGNAPSLLKAIKQSSLFAGASPLLPAYAYAFMNGENIFIQQRKKLRANIAYFTAHLPTQNTLKFLPGYPVFYSTNQNLGKKLKAQNIHISSFSYPSKDGPLLNRIVLNANHKKKELKKLLEELGK